MESVSDLGLHVSEELLTVLVEPALLATKQYQNNTLKQHKTLKRNPRTYPRHACSFPVFKNMDIDQIGSSMKSHSEGRKTLSGLLILMSSERVNLSRLRSRRQKR